MTVVIPMVVGLLMVLIGVICIKLFDEKIRAKFILKFIITWSIVVGFLMWLFGMGYIIYKL